jgi:hypothetical protein
MRRFLSRACPAKALMALLLLGPAPAFAQDWIYTVRPGDNLWDLTEQ